MVERTDIQEKAVLITNIVMELKAVPDEYLQTIYAIIHSFRTHLPQDNVMPKKNEKDNTENEKNSFDWIGLINEINESRNKNNIERSNRVDKLMW